MVLLHQVRQWFIRGLRFEQIVLIPIVGITILYVIPGLLGIARFGSKAAWMVEAIFLLGCLSYAVAWWGTVRYSALLKQVKIPRVTLNSDLLIAAVGGVYFIFFLYAALTAEHTAIIESLRGASADDIAAAREALFKNRQGYERSLVYLNAILTSAFVPYSIAIAYLNGKSYRHVYLALFVVTLLVSLEKAAVVKAFLPLVILAFNQYLPRRSGYIFLILMISTIISVTALTRMGAISSAGTEAELLDGSNLEQSGVVEDGTDALSRFQIIDTSNPVAFVVNRALWIPYITSYDWISYFVHKLDSKYLTGRTNLTVSILTGQSKFNMDRAVFAFEFGGDTSQTTGSANSVFLVDAFVNFGWLGVIFQAMLVALIARLVMSFGNPAILACFYYYIFQLLVGSFFSVMFSEGMLLFLIMAFFFTTPQMARDSALTAESVS